MDDQRDALAVDLDAIETLIRRARDPHLLAGQIRAALEARENTDAVPDGSVVPQPESTP